MPTPNPDERGLMAAALALARRGLGRVAPNPAVGCLILSGGRVVGRGWTQPGGRPHAETEALARAGAAASGGTAFVTLEPCAHQGRTPPCSQALIQAGIARCIVACEDPDVRVAGRGIAALRAAGVAVEVGMLRAEAQALNRGYFLHRSANRPLVTLKLAGSLDGRIALANGASRWITGPQARARAHLLRASHDAVLVGSETALVDDPRLDVRLPGLNDRRPLRVVLDSRLRLPPGHDLVRRAGEQACLLFTSEAGLRRAAAHIAAGVEVHGLPEGAAGGVDLVAALSALAERGVTRLLVEGGAQVAARLLQADLVDRLAWFRAATVIGGDGRPAIADLALSELTGMPRFHRRGVETLGEDLLELYERA